MPHEIQERRSFRMLPNEDIGFSRPALEFELPDGSRHVKVAHEFKAPQPELARSADDPGWWIITSWLPVGAVPLALVPDPSAPLL